MLEDPLLGGDGETTVVKAAPAPTPTKSTSMFGDDDEEEEDLLAKGKAPAGNASSALGGLLGGRESSLFGDDSSLFAGASSPSPSPAAKGTAGKTPATTPSKPSLDSLFGDSGETPTFFDDFAAPPALKKPAASTPSKDVDLFSDDMFSFQ